MRDGRRLSFDIGRAPGKSKLLDAKKLVAFGCVLHANGEMHTAKVSVKLKEYDDSNYTEEKTKVDLYGSIGNAITGIF